MARTRRRPIGHPTPQRDRHRRSRRDLQAARGAPPPEPSL